MNTIFFYCEVNLQFQLNVRGLQTSTPLPGLFYSNFCCHQNSSHYFLFCSANPAESNAASSQVLKVLAHQEQIDNNLHPFKTNWRPYKLAANVCGASWWSSSPICPNDIMVCLVELAHVFFFGILLVKAVEGSGLLNACKTKLLLFK